MTFHNEITAIMKANGWDYAYSCGYCHGKDDQRNHRREEIDSKSQDDFAKGYFKGFNA